MAPHLCFLVPSAPPTSMHSFCSLSERCCQQSPRVCSIIFTYILFPVLSPVCTFSFVSALDMVAIEVKVLTHALLHDGIYTEKHCRQFWGRLFLWYKTKALYSLSVKLSSFTVWRYSWQKNWVNCAVLAGNSTGLRVVLSSRLSRRERHSSLRIPQTFSSVSRAVFLHS
jgi:hypothetical protein